VPAERYVTKLLLIQLFDGEIRVADDESGGRVDNVEFCNTIFESLLVEVWNLALKCIISASKVDTFAQ
jgi:hypothetical protein